MKLTCYEKSIAVINIAKTQHKVFDNIYVCNNVSFNQIQILLWICPLSN